MSNTKVCVCIPCYNNELTIAETLDSVINQTYKNLFIKVFDNASTDSTRNIIEDFISKNNNIRLFTREKTVSGEENFNTCILAAEGEYTAIFHSDDVYESTIIADQVDFLIRHRRSLAVSTHASLINERGDTVGERMIPPELNSNCEYELDRSMLVNLSFKYGNFITCPSVLFRTDILINHIKIFNGKEFKSSADLNVWFRITEKGNIGYINKKLIRYRVSASSFSFNLARVRIQDHDLFLVLDDFLENTDLSDSINKKLVKYRNFLLMKDRANTNLNRLILSETCYQSIDLLNNLRYIFVSKFHMKYYMIAFFTRIIVLLPKIFNLSKILRKIKFNNV